MEVQKETRFKTPKSFDEAVQIAERYEGVTYQVQLPRTNNNRFNRANRIPAAGGTHRLRNTIEGERAWMSKCIMATAACAPDEPQSSS
jgi:hypothetical protein